MTVTVKGFQGTISDADMAAMFPHHMPTVPTAADLLVTAVAGARAVSVAAGTAHGPFLKYTSDSAQQVQLAPPSSGGKWYAITIDRQWSPTNTATLKADDLAVSNDGTLPTFPSAAALIAAAALPNQPGTAGSTAGQRQILALAFVRAADTTTYYFDTRMLATGSGILTAPHFAALLLANLRHLRDGAIVTVGRYPVMSGGTHVTSTWKRESAYLIPAGVIEGDGATDAQADSVAQDVSSLGSLAGMGTLAFPSHANTRFLNRRTQIEFAWTDTGWAFWNTKGNKIDQLFARQGDVGYDGAPGMNELSIRNGIATFTFSLYSGNARGSNGVFGQMVSGARPSNGPRAWFTGECYDGNDFLSAMYIDQSGNLAPTAPRTNGGAGYNAIRGTISYRCSG